MTQATPKKAHGIAHQYNGKRDRQPCLFVLAIAMVRSDNGLASAITMGRHKPVSHRPASCILPDGHSGPAKSIHSSDLLGYTREGSVLVSEAWHATAR